MKRKERRMGFALIDDRVPIPKIELLMNNQSQNDISSLDLELNLDEFDVERETLKSSISDAFNRETIDDELPHLLQEYRKKYGSDLFWKLSSFDLAELMHDPKTMGKLLPLLQEEPLSSLYNKVNVARYFYARGDHEGALEELKSVTNLEDTEEALIYLHLRGVTAFVLHDYRQAVKFLEDLLLDVEDEQAKALAGISYLYIGDRKRAAEYLEPYALPDHPLGVEWFYHILLNFEELEIIQNDAFPPKLYAALEEIGFGFLSSSLSLEQLEEIVARYPTFLLPRLEKIAQDHPHLEIPAYFAGRAAIALNKTQLARRWWRKVVTLPIGEDPSLEEKGNNPVTLKLLSLSLLQYSSSVETRYCKSYWVWAEEHHNDTTIIDLIGFCGMSETSNQLITKMLNEDQLPIPTDVHQTRTLHTGLLWYYFRLNDDLSTLDQAKFLYENHLIVDAYTLWIVAWIFFYFSEDDFELSEDPNHYQDIHLYLIDQLIALEYDLRKNRDEKVVSRLTKLQNLHKGESHFDWDIFDSFIPIFFHDIQDNRKLVTVMEKLFFFDDLDED